MNKKQKITGAVALVVATIAASTSIEIRYPGGRDLDGLLFAVLVVFVYAGLFFLLKDYRKPGPPSGPESPN